MIDFDKQPLAVGDLVAFLPPSYRHMIKGRVIGFTPKMIRIEHVLEPKQLELYRERNYAIPTSLRESGYIVKLPQNTL